MEITSELRYQKESLLEYFRTKINDELERLSLRFTTAQYKDKASEINKVFTKLKNELISDIILLAKNEDWSNVILLENILMITYTSYVVMLETRNSIWPYDYMAFSRRIGELWEPFCKNCFYFPTRNISIYEPPMFDEVKNRLATDIETFVNGLPILDQEKVQLQSYYNLVWNLVTSGQIQMKEDLHFKDGDIKYVVDFKSGFGSNEKGNTNRLLLVGNIYQSLNDNYRCLIFVRSTENNHYLQTLQNSGIWETSTGEVTYRKIEIFTGYDIAAWIQNNISWMNDFKPEMSTFVRENNLESYLVW